jgi:hypothetical protein
LKDGALEQLATNSMPSTGPVLTSGLLRLAAIVERNWHRDPITTVGDCVANCLLCIVRITVSHPR